MELSNLELEAFIPISVKILEGADVEVASAAILTAKRSDGGVELVIPQSRIWIDKDGNPVRAWAEMKDGDTVHESKIAARAYEIALPLMPPEVEPETEEEGAESGKK